MVFQRSLVANGGRTLSSSSSVAGVYGGGSLVAPGGMVGSRCPFAGSSSLSSVHRCLSFKLGGPSRLDSIQGMVSGGEPPSHQRAGDVSSVAGDGRFSPPVSK